MLVTYRATPTAKGVKVSVSLRRKFAPTIIMAGAMIAKKNILDFIFREFTNLDFKKSSSQ